MGSNLRIRDQDDIGWDISFQTETCVRFGAFVHAWTTSLTTLLIESRRPAGAFRTGVVTEPLLFRWLTVARLLRKLMPKKSSRGKKSKTKSAKVGRVKLEPIPKGFRSVTPYLAINGAAQALEWYKKAFGARELAREAAPDGKIVHARIRIGDSIVMMSDSFQGGSSGALASTGGPTVTLHIYSKNADKVWQQAVDAGAKVKMPIDSQYWGERYGQLTDPFGHNWSVSQRVQMSRQEMKEKQEQAMAMFSQGEHPGQEGQVGQSGQSSAMTHD